jgi:glycosyltransferase involved in cell wall biosynthesis
MLELILSLLFGMTTVISIVFAGRLLYCLKHFTMKRFMSEPSMLRDLPSVSVCIPARNETHAMTECLERVIASTYPKLEIIVLDDSSADNTSHLIKAFAHAGVRFVEGSSLKEGWLGKNYALQGLLHEASGSFVLFMDVDTHIKPDTIEQLVSYQLQERAIMVSVLPFRGKGFGVNTLLGTMRYFWELVLHRRSKPAVASNAWMIARDVLVHEYDSFNGMKTAIQPEAVIAASLSRLGNYRFLIGTKLIGVSNEKKWQAQVDTSIRLLFPILSGRFAYAIVGLGFLALLNLPTIFIINGFIAGWTIVDSTAILQLSVSIALYALYLHSVWEKGWWIGALLWPYIVAQEFVLLVISIIGYALHTIDWKGRPVSISLKSLREDKN